MASQVPNAETSDAWLGSVDAMHYRPGETRTRQYHRRSSMASTGRVAPDGTAEGNANFTWPVSVEPIMPVTLSDCLAFSPQFVTRSGALRRAGLHPPLGQSILQGSAFRVASYRGLD